MKKRFIISILMVLFLGTIAFAQSNWEFSKVFYLGPVHGVGVTPDNCVWVNVWSDSRDPSGFVRGEIGVFEADGTLKKHITEIPGDLEPTLYARGGGRGMSVGPDGKVYHSAYSTLYVMDYQTMECLRIITVMDPEESITTAVADEFGNIVVSTVGSPNLDGIFIFNGEDGTLMGMAVPPGVDAHSNCRDLALTKDGCNLFVASTFSTNLAVTHYYSEGGTFDSYEFVQEIGQDIYGGIAQDVHIDQYGRLWIGIDGNSSDGKGSQGQFARFECYDLSTMEIVDVITSPVYVEVFNTGVPDDQFRQGAFVTPRGFWLSNDGTKAYICDFNTGILEFVNTKSDAKEPQAVPEGFALSQNYPNPFNPSTNFSYSLPKTSDVRIAIYDLFGREINTLVNESKEAGTYTISWNGRDNQNRQVATGVYFYKMQAAGFEKTMKMMLVK